MYWEKLRPPFEMRNKGWHDFAYWKCTQPFRDNLVMWAKVSQTGQVTLIMEDVTDETKPFEIKEFDTPQQLKDFVQIMVGLLYLINSGAVHNRDGSDGREEQKG